MTMNTNKMPLGCFHARLGHLQRFKWFVQITITMNISQSMHHYNYFGDILR